MVFKCELAVKFHTKDVEVETSLDINRSKTKSPWGVSCQDNEDSLVDSWVYWFRKLQVQKQSTSK